MTPDTLPYPALHASHAGIWIAAPDGATRAVGRGEAVRIAAETPLIMLGAPLIGARLGYPDLSGLDLLELFAFIHPARFAVPTPAGLARALGIAPGTAAEDAVPRLLPARSRRFCASGGHAPRAHTASRHGGRRHRCRR